MGRKMKRKMKRKIKIRILAFSAAVIMGMNLTAEMHVDAEESTSVAGEAETPAIGEPAVWEPEGEITSGTEDAVFQNDGEIFCAVNEEPPEEELPPDMRGQEPEGYVNESDESEPDESESDERIVDDQKQEYRAADSTGEKIPATGDGGRLSPDVITYTSVYEESRQIASPAQEGVYFLNGDRLILYSLNTAETEVVYVFEKVIEDSYEADGKLYVLEYSYGGSQSPGSRIIVYNLDEKRQENDIELDITATSIGVDGSGRIYASGWEGEDPYIYLYTRSGERLSSVQAPDSVYGIGGFDSTNGNFYYEYYYNWVYWGYDHSMHALGVGSVSGDELRIYTGEPVSLVCQSYFYERQNMLEMIGSRYLCMDNTFHSGLEILDSSKINPDAPEENILLHVDRDNNNADGEFDGCACIGTRTVFCEERGSVITFRNDRTLVEYVPGKETPVGEYETAWPVFSLMNYGSDFVAIEKEGSDFYIELLKCQTASRLEITGASAQMTPGSRMQLSVTSDGTIKNNYTWSSSDSKTVSVSQSGEIFAWHKGTAVITVKTQGGISASCTVRVVPGASSGTKKSSVKLAGKVSNNISGNNYSTYGRIVNSYMAENTDGTLTRLEYISGALYAETFYSDNGKLKSSKTIKMELPIFGGFFSGSEYNYIVFGKKNTKEQDSAEILRVVKYSKGWDRIAAASVCGANTTVPFDAGSLRMAESNGFLYIHTCHEMYTSSDGLNHQANMSYVIRENDMSVEQSYYDVMNLAQAGYVSHSFNQFIQTDGQYVYRVDHGDAYPRAVSITRCSAGGNITDVSYDLPLQIGGNAGNNSTGVSVGGFELASETCLISGNSVAQGNNFKNTYGQRNIFVTVTSKDMKNSRIVWMTKYSGGQVTVYTPHLVKLGEDQFLLAWEEYYTKTGKTITKMTTLNGNAELTSDIIACRMSLSSCKPVVRQDGSVAWYTGDGTSLVLYSLNPYDLDSVHEPSLEKEAAGKIKVKKILISGISKKIAAGKRIKLTAEISPSNASNKTVTWKSGNKKIATVDSRGVVKIKAGTGGKKVTITATAKDKSKVKASYKITSMKGAVKKIIISGKTSVKAGKSLKLTAKVTATKGANKKLKWKSSNTKYATVSGSGKVTAKSGSKEKKVKITAMATDGSGKKKSVTITIK